jgi:predicted O-methyltransferase YrrM
MYDNFLYDKREALIKLTNADPKLVDLALTDFSNNTQFSSYIDNALNFGYDLLEGGISSAGDIELIERSILYCLVRILKPNIVLETGVANGVSSAFILKALDENQKGFLFSIDLPSVALKAIFHRDSGWIIPKELRKRWTLYLGKSSSVLPRVLPKLKDMGGVDLFFHDSDHSYDNMMFEFRTVYPFIRDGGLLTCDDATIHDALLDFADSVKKSPIIIRGSNFGAIRK